MISAYLCMCIAVAPEARGAWQISSLFSIMIRDTEHYRRDQPVMKAIWIGLTIDFQKKKHTEVSDSSWGYPQETPPFSDFPPSTIQLLGVTPMA